MYDYLQILLHEFQSIQEPVLDCFIILVVLNFWFSNI